MGVHYNKADFITYGRPSLFLDFANKKSLTDRISGNNLITFTRTSTGTYVGADGLIKTATTNEARFDHNPATGESLGLLIEEQRTNLKTYSSNFNEVNDNNNSGLDVTNGQYGQPFDGNAIFFDHKTIIPGYWRPNNSVTLTAGVTYTTSIFFKAINPALPEVSLVHICYDPFAVAADVYISTMYSNGTYQNYPNGWRRYWHTFTPSQTLTYQIGPSINQNDNLKGSGYIGGMQVEQGTFPTSYIPTSGSQVTRNADSASITGSNLTSFYNQTQGTLFCRFRNFGYGDAYHAGGGGVSFDNSGPARPLLNLISLNMRRDGPFYRNGALIVANNTTFTDSLTTSGSSNNISDTVNYYNFAGSFSPSRRAFTYNGLTPGVNATTIDMPTISRFLISTNSNYLYDPFTGYISKISYYPSQLTDTQLQNLTK